MSVRMERDISLLEVKQRLGFVSVRKEFKYLLNHLS